MTDEERKKKQREYQRQYRADHPEYVEKGKQRAKAYYRNNKEKSIASTVRWQKAHPERVAEYQLRYWKKKLGIDK